MYKIDVEAEWLANLALNYKLGFLARLSFKITVAGRGSYEVGTEELTNPRHLRRFNEIQHRVTACLSQLLDNDCPDGFVDSMASLVLAPRDSELQRALEWCWSDAKKWVSRNYNISLSAPIFFH